MRRQFEIDLTPATARQLVRLQKLVPETVVDPAIVEIAEQGLFDPASAPELSRSGLALVQDLLDFDLRAIVSLSTRLVINERVSQWLMPVIRAAQVLGVRDLVAAGSVPHTKIAAVAREHGMTVHVLDDSWTTLPDDNTIPRDAILIAPAGQESLSRLNRSVLALSMEFPRTVVLADPLSSNQTRLYPKMPSLLSVFNKKTFPGQTTSDISFLFSTSYALSRGTG